MNQICLLSCGFYGGGSGNLEGIPMVPRSVANPISKDKYLLEMVDEYGKPQLDIGEVRSLALLVVKRTVGYMEKFVSASNPTHEIS